MYDPRHAPLVPFAPLREVFLRDGDTPSALLERCIRTVEAREPDVRAFVTLDQEGARAAAAASDARYRAGAPLSPIDGMPFGVKDIIDTGDMPTQMNSGLYAGHRPFRDAAGVQAMRAGGAVILGKTVTTEFACGESGPTRNPFDLERTPGGSSSGSGAGVGAGMMCAAFGTQTRASIVRPAAYNGAYGYKPTVGALNLGGVHPVSPTLDHLGSIAASLADCWLVARHVAAAVGADHHCRPLAGPAELPPPAVPNRVAFIRTNGWAETPAESQAAFEGFLDFLRNIGVTVSDASADGDLAAFETALRPVDAWSRELMAYEMRWPMRGYRDRGGNALGPTIQALLQLSDGMSEADYGTLLDRRNTLIAQHAALAMRYDLIVTLCSDGPAPKGLAFTGNRSFITPWSVLGAPALALPMLAAEDMPLGVQMIGYRGADAAMMGYARWIDEGWFGKV
ncbi:MAG: amidase [Alphaproteobacteria bacterium]